MARYFILQSARIIISIIYGVFTWLANNINLQPSYR